MQFQQLANQRGPFARVDKRLPAAEDFTTLQGAQRFQSLNDEIRPSQKIVVILEQEINAGIEAGFDVQAFAAAHALDERLRYVQIADFPAFGFNVDRSARVESLQGFQQVGFKPFLRGLRLFRQHPKY